MLDGVSKKANPAIESGNHRLRCPVCGATELTVPPYREYEGSVPPAATPPYEDFLGRPSYEVCPSCGFEFGFDDNPGGDAQPMSFVEYRKQWEAEGSPRFSS